MGTSRPLLLLKMPEQIYTGVQNILKWSHQIFFSFGCWFWARKFKFIIWNEFSSPLWRQNFIICLLRLAIVLQRWNFVKCTSNYLNFTKASSTLHSYTQLLEIPKYVSQRLFTSHCWKINTKSTYVNPKILAILARNFKF